MPVSVEIIHWPKDRFQEIYTITGLRWKFDTQWTLFGTAVAFFFYAFKITILPQRVTKYGLGI